MKRFFLSGVVIAMLWACGSSSNGGNQPDATTTDSVTDTVPGTDVVTDTAPATDTVTDTVPGTDTTPGTDVATDTAPGTDTTPGTDAATDTAPGTDTTPGTDVATDTAPGTDTVTDTAPATDTVTDTATDTDTSTDSSQPPAAHFTSPEGIAASGSIIFVADPAAAYDSNQGKMTYGQSHLVVIDASQSGFPVIKDIQADAKNLQTVTIGNGTLCAVASGTATYDMSSGKMTPDSPGKLYCMAPDSDHFTTAIDLPLSQTNKTVGLPASIVMLGNFVYIGSGTAPAVYKVDMSSKTVVKGADNPIWVISNANTQQQGMIKLITDGTKLYALDFNTDSIFSIDPSTDVVRPLGQFGDDPDKMEGPIAGLISKMDHKIYTVMSVGNSLWQITPSPFAAKKIGATGSAPNAMAEYMMFKSMFIANSMDNNISQYSLMSNKVTTYAALDPGADPWDLVITKVNRKPMMFVTAYMEKDVYAFDMNAHGATLAGKIK